MILTLNLTQYNQPTHGCIRQAHERSRTQTLLHINTYINISYSQINSYVQTYIQICNDFIMFIIIIHHRKYNNNKKKSLCLFRNNWFLYVPTIYIYKVRIGNRCDIPQIFQINVKMSTLNGKNFIAQWFRIAENKLNDKHRRI